MYFKMDKKTILAVIVTLLITAILFVLPRTVVENTTDNSELEAGLGQTEEEGAHAGADENSPDEATVEVIEEEGHEGHDHTGHRPDLADDTRRQIASLAENARNEQKGEKFAIFADSLSTLWANAGWYDSAATWAEQAIQAKSTEERLYRAGNYWYEAAGMMHDELDMVRRYQQRAAVYLEQVVKENPKRSDARVRLAMTKVEGPNPMEGIMMLRQVLEEEPNNSEALFNMGMLSWRSNQYDKAVERLNKLVKLQPDHLNGQFYLALSYIQLGDNAKAKQHFQQVKRLSTDAEVLAAIEEYLKQL
jgi:tetratricopeptide (TPR) repeat protein